MPPTSIIARFMAITLAVCTLFTSIHVSAQSASLTVINSKIDAIKQLLLKETSRRDTLQKKLKGLDENTGSLSKKISTSQQQATKQRQQIKKLKQQQQQYQQQLSLQKKQVSSELTATYIASRQPYLKLLLTQKNPQDLTRMTIYYNYLYQYQQQLIEKLQNTLKKLSANKNQLEKQQKKLDQLIKTQQKERSALSQTAKQRQYLITTINKNINNKNQQLTTLSHNKQQLERTLQQLENHPPSNNSGQNSNFIDLKGHLAWPTQGKVIKNFGTKIQQSELTWAGVLVNAPTGQPVYAIAEGQVVFAKWLSGYGLLVIINHGNGYMTLYGRNQALYTQKGTHVMAGDQIATVGQTGGYNSPSLYFAIRHNAKPLNPSQWCHFASAAQTKGFH